MEADKGKITLKVTSADTRVYVQEQKRAYAETGNFIQMLSNLNLVKREGNQIKPENLTFSDEPDISPAKYLKTLDPVTRILTTFRSDDSSLYTADMLSELKMLL